jgi:hypothetical protein
MGFALKTWVGEFGDMRVGMLVRELGFVKPPSSPSLIYDDCFGIIVILDANGVGTTIGYTN